MPNLGLATLSVAQRRGRSVVVDQYSQAPLQLHRPLYFADSVIPTVYLKSPSAGLLDGDEHRLQASVESGAGLELRTQASTLVYPGISSQSIELNISENSSLIFLPHPLILAKGANFTQTISIKLCSTSRLLFRDSWSAGRIAMGECWQFESFSNFVQIYVDGKLSFREKWTLTPHTMPLDHPLLCGSKKNFSNLYDIGRDALHAPFNHDHRVPGACNAPLQCEHESCSWTMTRPEAKIHRYASE